MSSKPKVLTRKEFNFYNNLLNLHLIVTDYDIRNKEKYMKLCLNHYRFSKNRTALANADFHQSIGTDFMVKSLPPNNTLTYQYYITPNKDA